MRGQVDGRENRASMRPPEFTGGNNTRIGESSFNTNLLQ